MFDSTFIPTTDHPRTVAEYSNAEADRLILSRHLSNRLSAELRMTLDLLAVASVLTVEQVCRGAEISIPSLRRYVRDGYLAYHRTTPSKLWPQTAVVTLGTLGRAYGRFWHTLSDKYDGYPFHQTDHDLGRNEIILILLERARREKRPLEWSGSYEARICDEAGEVLIEPDARLVIGDRTLLWEHHQEHHRGRVADKIERYEACPDTSLPIIGDAPATQLICVTFVHRVVLDGYAALLRDRHHGGQTLRHRWLAKSLHRARDQPDQIAHWYDLTHAALTGETQFVNLFTHAVQRQENL